VLTHIFGGFCFKSVASALRASFIKIQEKAEQYARELHKSSIDFNGSYDIAKNAYVAGYNEAKRWIPVGEQTPPEGEDVLFFNLKWIHPDFNIKGVRIGYLNMNIYHTAKCYDDIYSHSESDEPNEVKPTHWREI